MKSCYQVCKSEQTSKEEDVDWELSAVNSDVDSGEVKEEEVLGLEYVGGSGPLAPPDY